MTTKNLPVPSNAVKAHIKLRRQQPIDTMVCLLLSLGLVSLLVKPLADYGVLWMWWSPFCVVNLIYILDGMKKGKEGDPANALMIFMGPIPLYFWVMIYIWRTYHVYKKGGYGWTLQKLEKKLVNKNLSQGFDFEFPYKHRRKVNGLLRACKLTVEEVLDRDWAIATGSPWCLSITDTPENMLIRESGR
jgi:hypothetical protein